MGSLRLIFRTFSIFLGMPWDINFKKSFFEDFCQENSTFSNSKSWNFLIWTLFFTFKCRIVSYTSAFLSFVRNCFSIISKRGGLRFSLSKTEQFLVAYFKRFAEIIIFLKKILDPVQCKFAWNMYFLHKTNIVFQWNSSKNPHVFDFSKFSKFSSSVLPRRGFFSFKKPLKGKTLEEFFWKSLIF